MLTDLVKSRIRLHAGYPIFSNAAQLASLKWGQQAWHMQVQNQNLEFSISNVSAIEEGIVRDELLPNLEQLRADVYNVRENSDTASAAVWTRNPSELIERGILYRMKRVELCQFLNIAVGPMLASGSARLRT